MVAKAIRGTISIASGAAPYSLAITPDDKTLYVAEVASIGGLYAVDLESGTVKQLPIAVYTATGLVLTPDATRLWICNNTGDVTVVDALTSTIVAHLPVARPWSVAFNRTGTRAYITSAPPSGNGTVEVYDANSYANLASIPVGMRPHGVGVTPSGRHVFVVNRWTPGSIVQISTATNTVIRTIPTGDFPGGLGMEH
jgi:YVTN family beta-propeller protein